MNEKRLRTASRIISGIFNPFIIPFGGFLVLFLFSYLRIMPFQYKLIVLAVVYCFTILMPMLTIFLFQKINGWGIKELSHREKRFIPYILTIMAYVFCLLMMYKLNLPRYMSGIILATLIAMVICIFINLKWKISEHMTGMGGVVGGLIAFSFLFNYNPVWWLCFFILIAGMLGTSRIILKQHTLGQVLSGFVVGVICAVYGILYS
ncbi:MULTISPECIES: hypothetical protein [unclassified Bacteroides]|jgi:hypothetical protein|uniref:hypothetical protein n=1 Tax=unclassified Bacteroides TaxID=2646097 RepID=UPI000E8D0CB4|nr:MULTISPECIES: hypothetical protein [unclassified Bacteroides]RGN47090.1 hypothetical protein DXB63_09965 [Bacteroides sp. OM05-12]RHR77382.1 hypothetical protein DWW69_05940 [Bacteroides sp. AF16-49]